VRRVRRTLVCVRVLSAARQTNATDDVISEHLKDGDLVLFSRNWRMYLVSGASSQTRVGSAPAGRGAHGRVKKRQSAGSSGGVGAEPAAAELLCYVGANQERTVTKRIAQNHDAARQRGANCQCTVPRRDSTARPKGTAKRHDIAGEYGGRTLAEAYRCGEAMNHNEHGWLFCWGVAAHTRFRWQ
jgi:hypothetical protein